MRGGNSQPNINTFIGTWSRIRQTSQLPVEEAQNPICWLHSAWPVFICCLIFAGESSTSRLDPTTPRTLVHARASAEMSLNLTWKTKPIPLDECRSRAEMHRAHEGLIGELSSYRSRSDSMRVFIYELPGMKQPCKPVELGVTAIPMG